MRIPCGVRFRKHPSSSRRTMGCFASKPDVPPPATTTTTGQEMSQRQPFPVAPPVARAASRSSQRSRANSEHRSPQGGYVPKRERPKSRSNPQKRQPMMSDEDVWAVPSHSRTQASTMASSSRNTSTPPSAGEYDVAAAGPPNYLTNNHTKSSQSQPKDDRP